MTKSEISEAKPSVDAACEGRQRSMCRVFRRSAFGFLSSFGLRISALICLLGLFLTNSLSGAPLRVFIRAGVKTHGPNQHDHPRFLEDWEKLLTERGVHPDGALDFPTPTQLANTDVLIIYAQD